MAWYPPQALHWRTPKDWKKTAVPVRLCLWLQRMYPVTPCEVVIASSCFSASAEERAALGPSLFTARNPGGRECHYAVPATAQG